MPQPEYRYEIEEPSDRSLVAVVHLHHVGRVPVAEATRTGKTWAVSLWNDERGCSATLSAADRADALAALDFHAAMVARLLTPKSVSA